MYVGAKGTSRPMELGEKVELGHGFNFVTARPIFLILAVPFTYDVHLIAARSPGLESSHEEF